MVVRMIRAWFLLPAAVAATQPAAVEAGVRPVRLRCEYQANPLGIDVVRPRLRRILEQGYEAMKRFVDYLGATAMVYVPTSDVNAVTESGKSARQAEGASYVGRRSGAAAYRVSSGRYTFTAPY